MTKSLFLIFTILIKFSVECASNEEHFCSEPPKLVDFLSECKVPDPKQSKEGLLLFKYMCSNADIWFKRCDYVECIRWKTLACQFFSFILSDYMIVAPDLDMGTVVDNLKKKYRDFFSRELKGRHYFKGVEVIYFGKQEPFFSKNLNRLRCVFLLKYNEMKTTFYPDIKYGLPKSVDYHFKKIFMPLRLYYGVEGEVSGFRKFSPFLAEVYGVDEGLIFYHLGKSFFERDRVKAIECFETVTCPESLLFMGYIYQDDGNYVEAYNCYKNANNSEGHYNAALILMSSLYNEENMRESALRHCKKSNEDAAFLMASEIIRSGFPGVEPDLERAISMLERILDKEISGGLYDEVCNNLGSMYQDLASSSTLSDEERIANLKKAVEMYERSGTAVALVNVGRIHEQLNELDLALNAFKQADSLDGKLNTIRISMKVGGLSKAEALSEVEESCIDFLASNDENTQGVPNLPFEDLGEALIALASYESQNVELRNTLRDKIL